MLKLVENLVAYEPNERLDFFSIVLFLTKYRKWKDAEVFEFFESEKALSKARTEGSLELMKEHNEMQGYLRLA